MAPAFEHVDKADLPVIEDNGAKARVVMGSLWGRQAPTTTYASTIYADIVLADGGAIPIDAEAGERAIYVAEGDASLDGLPPDPMTQIGRASCRERVCQSGSISVVAASFNNKKKSQDRSQNKK